MPRKRIECFRLLLVCHKRFKERRKSVRDDESCGRSKEINTSWLAKGLGLVLLSWGFKDVQEEIPSEEVNTLKIGSVAFSPGQCAKSTTPSLSQTIWPRWASRQFLSLLIVQTLLPVTFGYSLSSEAVVMRQLRWKVIDTLTQEDFHGAFQKLLERYKWIAAGEITSKETIFSCVYYQ